MKYLFHNEIFNTSLLLLHNRTEFHSVPETMFVKLSSVFLSNKKKKSIFMCTSIDIDLQTFSILKIVRQPCYLLGTFIKDFNDK